MKTTITIIDRYEVRMNREVVETVDTPDEAVDEIVTRNYDRIDRDIMEQPGVSDESASGLNEEAYNRAWADFKAKVADAIDGGCAYDDDNGHRWTIKAVKAVKRVELGHIDFAAIELDVTDSLYGRDVMTDAGLFVALRRLNDALNRDEDVRVYEAMSLADGHREVLASDNASCWIVGDENNAEVNRSHFALLAKHDVRWCEIIDGELADWIEDRRAEAGCKEMFV